MVDFLKKTADKHKIDWQPEVLAGGGTDTAGIQRMATHGTIAGAISIPTRHLHQVIEMAHKRDIRLSIDLLKRSLEELSTYDWSHK
jgi:endoglucanase